MTRVKKNLLAELEEQLKFETLLNDISTHFIDLPADQVDNEIKDAMRRVCECLGLDAATLWLWRDDNPHTLTLTHYYRSLPGPLPPERMDADIHFPWVQKQLFDGKIVALNVDEMPPEAARDQETYRQYNIKSALSIPLFVKGEAPIGDLSFVNLLKKYDWPDITVKRLKLIAQMFVNALSRRRAQQMIQESEERLSLAVESADAGIWNMDTSSGLFWVTDKMRELFQFAHDEELNIERFLEVTHPDDRERVRKAVLQSVKTRELMKVEYRILHPDGSVHWIAVRGRPYTRKPGSTDLMMGVSIDVTKNKEMEVSLQEHLKEIERLRQQLEDENIYLREDVKAKHGFEDIVGNSDALSHVIFKTTQVAPTDTTVLITGETGTGKGLIAHAIYEQSLRKDKVMITVNCAALPSNLIESELFGREKGAFTGAHQKQAGRFEVADGGTIFLDEIGELPPELQSKLLRILQDGEFERLGSSKTIKVNVRVIASTSRNLKDEIQRGQFRQDLFYRLNVFPIMMPPLRNRKEDIPQLVSYFLKKYNRKIGKDIKTIPKSTIAALERYSWPGNIRELEHVIERAVITSPASMLRLSEYPESLEKPSHSIEDRLENLDTVERNYIIRVLRETSWKIEGENGAAIILGLHPNTLHSRMKKLNIKRT